MTRDKAIDIIRGELFGKAFDNPEVKEAFVKLIPELGDSWNENVRKQLMETVKTAMTKGGVWITEERGQMYLKFLENMKRIELSEDEVPLIESIIKDVRKQHLEWGDYPTPEEFNKEVIKRYNAKRFLIYK